MKIHGLEIEIEEMEEDGIVMMRLCGRIDTRTCDTLQKAIQEVFNSGFYRIVLDVSKNRLFFIRGTGRVYQLQYSRHRERWQSCADESSAASEHPADVDWRDRHGPCCPRLYKRANDVLMSCFVLKFIQTNAS
jgi:hypothetical protein